MKHSHYLFFLKNSHKVKITACTRSQKSLRSSLHSSNHTNPQKLSQSKNQHRHSGNWLIFKLRKSKTITAVKENAGMRSLERQTAIQKPSEITITRRKWKFIHHKISLHKRGNQCKNGKDSHWVGQSVIWSISLRVEWSRTGVKSVWFVCNWFARSH